MGRGGRELRGRSAAARVRAVAARRHERGRARDRRRRQRLAPTGRSPTRRARVPGGAGGRRRRQPRVRGGRQPRHRAHDGAGRRRRATPTSRWRPGTAAAMLARFDAEPDLAAVGPALRNPDGTQYPSARAHVRGRRRGRARGARAARGRATASPVATASSTPTGTGPATSTGCRARWCSCGAPRSTRSGAGTSATSCTWRTSTCAGACVASGWRVGYEPGGAVVHVQGASTEAHPYRMILEHHRSVYRFAARRWQGLRRRLLPPAAVFLAVRARARHGRAGAPHAPGAAEGQRVTCDRHAPVPDPLPARRHALQVPQAQAAAERLLRLERRHRRRRHRRRRGDRAHPRWGQQRRERPAPRRRPGHQRAR